MCATPKTYSPSRTVGPSVTFSSLGSRVFLLPDCTRPSKTGTGRDQHRGRTDGDKTMEREAAWRYHGCVRVLAAAAAGRRREKEKARVRRNSERGRGEERTEKWVEITPGVNSVQWAHSLEGLLQREWAWFSSLFPACAGRLVARVLEVLAQHSTLRSISKQRNCLCQKKTKKLSTAFFHPGG